MSFEARSFLPSSRSSLDQSETCARAVSVSHRLDVEPPATCEGCTAPVAAVDLCAMARRTVRRSVLTKSRTERVAEPSSDRALQFIHRLSRTAPYPPPTLFCGAKQRRGRAVSPIAGAVVTYSNRLPFREHKD